MNELPLLDETRCTACGDCVFVCPVECLEMHGDIPWLVRPRDCVSCSLCVVICPADALCMAAMAPDEDGEDPEE